MHEEGTHDMAHLAPTRHHWGEVRRKCFYRNDRYLVRTDAHCRRQNPIWAIASMVAASDPQVKEAVRIFKSRLINVLLGCAVGLIFVVIGGTSEWKLPIALAVTVLLSSYWVQIPTMWRQAPITAAIVIAAGLTDNSKLSGIVHGVHKVVEVIFGCLVGLFVSMLMSKVWPVAEPENRP